MLSKATGFSHADSDEAVEIKSHLVKDNECII